MNTLFEFMLIGVDAENLSAAGEAALDEIERVELLLSRFDPRSETYRINRQASKAPVIVDFELWDILEQCQQWSLRTEGFFDLTTRSRAGKVLPVGTDFLLLDDKRRTIAFTHPEIDLDFGAFGKGYALDCAAALLREYGICQALLHGGTSSVLALGAGIDGEPWRVGLRDLRIKGESPSSPSGCNSKDLSVVALDNCALSSSAVLLGTPGSSDIINPHTAAPLGKVAGCAVIGGRAAEAEILSTALLCMGTEKAAEFCRSTRSSDFSVAWLSASDDHPPVRWLCTRN